eukprot:scaffold3060_cov112-Skeletonema_dohrnii-CCMP3373.AAC.3
MFAENKKELTVLPPGRMFDECINQPTPFVSFIRPPNIGKNMKKIKQRAIGYLLLATNPSSHNFSSDLVSGRALSPSNARDPPSLLYRQFTVKSAPPILDTSPCSRCRLFADEVADVLLVVLLIALGHVRPNPTVDNSAIERNGKIRAYVRTYVWYNTYHM